MNPWVAFFIGVFLGSISGVVMISLCVVGRRADRSLRRFNRWDRY